MRTLLAFIALALIANAQNNGKAPRKIPVKEKPGCSKGAICFAGEVSEGREFRWTLDGKLEFVLSPSIIFVPTGWTITIAPKRPEDNCDEFASVVNPPYRGHKQLDIDTSYGVMAE